MFGNIAIILAYQRMIGLFGALGFINEFHKEAPNLFSDNNSAETLLLVELIKSHQNRLNDLADKLEERHQQIKQEKVGRMNVRILTMEELFNSILHSAGRIIPLRAFF